MKRLFLSVLTLLLAVGLGGGRQGFAGQPTKGSGAVSSRAQAQSGGPMSQMVGPGEEKPMTDETHSEKENLQGQIEVTVSRDFSITLASNPTTGYQWELADPLDEAVVKLVSREYKGPETKLIGAGGQEIWTFRAVSRGQTLISLKYVRPWEKGVAPDKTASYTVIVH